MSLKHLPEIHAARFQIKACSGLKWEVPSDAMAKWHPQAAKDDSATISIFEGIGEQFDGSGMTARRISGMLRANDSKDISVAINSPGGDFFEGVAIYNLLREHRGKVTVKIIGLAASAASVIAMAGDEIQIAKSGFLMIHNAWSVVMGNRHDLTEAATVLETFDAAMAGVYASRTGGDILAMAELMDKNTWLNGEDAVKNGFADALLNEEDKNTDSAEKRRANLRLIESALSEKGLSRAQRREILSDITGMPGATLDAETPTPGAGFVGALQNLLNSTQEAVK